jgi:hypothetical protein
LVRGPSGDQKESGDQISHCHQVALPPRYLRREKKYGKVEPEGGSGDDRPSKGGKPEGEALIGGDIEVEEVIEEEAGHRPES